MMTKVSATVLAVMEGGNSAMVVAAMDVDEGRRGEGGVHRGEQARRRRSRRRAGGAGDVTARRRRSRRRAGDVTATGGGWRWRRDLCRCSF
ncbi:hypothetical protein RHGRI_013541 [Rhododendron griersonianum]|uniref:Uncharacterized protein n=1 Tax=Rhododendron griersonianum TaxID=479676 RepID=A0AAV6K6E2_9ERIC|nr:hypothetical protein RHGRI_013541 [Rhododendron griersonianum]